MLKSSSKIVRYRNLNNYSQDTSVGVNKIVVLNGVREIM